MARRKRSSVERYHDRVAGRYEHSYDDAFWQWHDALTWDYLKPYLPRNQRAQVLDLGCGPGKWAARLLKSGYTVTCVDVSHSMLEQARKNLASMLPLAKATFVHADLCDLGALPAEAFALALALGDPVGCVVSPVEALRQIRRLLTDDGILVFTVDNRLAAIDYYLQKEEPSELARFLRDGQTHWLTKNPKERFPIHTFAPRDVPRLVEAAGFRLREIVGKTVLPMRQHRPLLESPPHRRAWSRLEKSLARDPAAIGRASHLQVACEVFRRC